MSSKRIHYHLLVVMAEDIRSGIDFDAVKRGDYRSASRYLRGEWKFWRDTAPKYGFGRTELLPIRKTAEGVAKYVGKYVAKHIGKRLPEDTREPTAHVAAAYEAVALLTPAERSFFGVLQQALASDYKIFAKVRLADIVHPVRSASRSGWQSAFNRISGKHVDFVLCDSVRLGVVGVIELDDRTAHMKGLSAAFVTGSWTRRSQMQAFPFYAFQHVILTRLCRFVSRWRA